MAHRNVPNDWREASIFRVKSCLPAVSDLEVVGWKPNKRTMEFGEAVEATVWVLGKLYGEATGFTVHLCPEGDIEITKNPKKEPPWSYS